MRIKYFDAVLARKFLQPLPSSFLFPSCSYNKREDDFTTKDEYDDYLEEREDISERGDAITSAHVVLHMTLPRSPLPCFPRSSPQPRRRK